MISSGQSRASLKRKKQKNVGGLAGKLLQKSSGSSGTVGSPGKDADKSAIKKAKTSHSLSPASATLSTSGNSMGNAVTAKSKALASLQERFEEPDISMLSFLDILHLEDPSEVQASRRAAMLMSKIISPTTREKFYTQNWEKAPLLIERNSRHHFKELFSRKGFKAILQDYAAYYGVDVEVSKVSSQGRKSYAGVVVDHDAEDPSQKNTNENDTTAKSEISPVRAKPSDIWRCQEEGYAVRLLCPQKYDDVLWAFLSALEHEYDCSVGCEADLLGPGCQGYKPAIDTAESIVLQISGETRWRLWQPLPGAELPVGMPSDFPIVDDDARQHGSDGARAAQWDRILRAGDTLYIPRGWGYATVSNASEAGDHSLHLRIHTNRGNSIVDLLQMIVPAAIDAVAEESVQARQGLHRTYQSFLGIANSETEDPYRLAHRGRFMQNASQLMSTIAKATLGLIDVGSDQMAKKFIAERLPVPLSDAEETASAAGNRDARIFIYTRLRMLRPGIARLMIEGDMCVLYHCMDNSREQFGAPLQPLEFELDDGPAIEALLLAYPEAISVADLPHPSEEDDDKIGVAQALFKEGFLIIDDDASKPSMDPQGSSDNDDDPF